MQWQARKLGFMRTMKNYFGVLFTMHKMGMKKRGSGCQKWTYYYLCDGDSNKNKNKCTIFVLLNKVVEKARKWNMFYAKRKTDTIKYYAR